MAWPRSASLERFKARRRLKRRMDEVIRERAGEFDRLIFLMEQEELRHPGTWSRGEIERRRVAYAQRLARLEWARYGLGEWPADEGPLEPSPGPSPGPASEPATEGRGDSSGTS